MPDPVGVVVYWRPERLDDGTERTGGHPGYQPAGWAWPAGAPLPEVGDQVRAPSGASPLGTATVRVESRTWEVGASYFLAPPTTMVLRLDCVWVTGGR